MEQYRQNDGHPQNGAHYALSPRLQSLGRSVLSVPCLYKLRPWARQVIAVTEIPGIPVVAKQPARGTARSCNTLGVISANLWHDWPRFRRLPERLEAFAHLVEEKNADILLLQEVSRRPGLHVDEWLAERLGMEYVYSRANGHSQIGFEEGIAIYSRFPLHSPGLLQLGKSSSPFIRRLGLSALVNTPCGSLHAFSVHLGIRKRDNASQIEHLHQWVGQSAHRRPALIGGDFNVHETSSRLKYTRSVWVDTFRQVNSTNDGYTHTFRWPWGGVMARQRLDYIFLSSETPDWQVTETQHLTTAGLAHSDHKLVYTRLMPVVVNHQK